MDKTLLIVFGIVALAIVLITVVVLNSRSNANLAKYSLLNNALNYKNTELQTKVSGKDWLASTTSLLGSAASIYSSMGSSGD